MTADPRESQCASVRHVPMSIGFPDEWEIVVGGEVLSVERSQKEAEAFARGYNLIRNEGGARVG